MIETNSTYLNSLYFLDSQFKSVDL